MNKSQKYKHLKGTKAISSVKVFKSNFWPKWYDNFKEKITIIIVVKYASHESRVKRFFRFQNFVVSGGYLEKKLYGAYNVAGRQLAILLTFTLHA